MNLTTLGKLALAATLATSAATASAGVTFVIGHANYWGRLPSTIVQYNPTLLYSQPLIAQPGIYSSEPPLFLNIPLNQAYGWNRYCFRYNACNRPVYFVHPDWYRDVYAPIYRNQFARHEWHRRGFGVWTPAPPPRPHRRAIPPPPPPHWGAPPAAHRPGWNAPPPAHRPGWNAPGRPPHAQGVRPPARPDHRPGYRPGPPNRPTAGSLPRYHERGPGRH